MSPQQQQQQQQQSEYNYDSIEFSPTTTLQQVDLHEEPMLRRPSTMRRESFIVQFA